MKVFKWKKTKFTSLCDFAIVDNLYGLVSINPIISTQFTDIVVSSLVTFIKLSIYKA